MAKSGNAGNTPNRGWAAIGENPDLAMVELLKKINPDVGGLDRHSLNRGRAMTIINFGTFKSIGLIREGLSFMTKCRSKSDYTTID
jgi:hypothetical protein